MYQQFFNFKTLPFSIAPDPQYIYRSEEHEEGLAHLFYGVKHDGFVALTGEVGTGKTMLCHYFLEHLPENIDIALILNPKLNTIELLATICDELLIEYDHEHQTIKSLIDSLNRHLLEAHELGWNTVLMIDEAQNLSLDVLEQIRLLTNLETSKTKLLQIILVGQPELKTLLELPELRQLNQRITARYHLDSLSFLDTQKYIKHRLKLSGGNINIFNHGAIRQVFKLSKGIPRLINILSDRALLGAYAINSDVVTAKIVKTASKEVLNVAEKLPAKLNLINTLSGSIILAILISTIYFLIPVKASKKQLVLSGSFSKPVVSEIQKKLDTVKKPQLSSPQTLDFASNLKQHKLSLNMAILKLAELWNKEPLLSTGCKDIEQTGLRCLLKKTSWEKLVAYNRPVIMEFSFSENETFYALLLGLKEGNPVFKFDEEKIFPVRDVLSLWEGYSIMLWQPPIDNIEIVSFGFSSEVVLWIRKQLAANHHKLTTVNSVYFDEELKNEIIKFQQQHNLRADGIVGSTTFIHLSNGDQQNNSPKLKLKF